VVALARPAPNTAPTQAKASGLDMICTMAKHEAEAQGCDDALMLDWRGQFGRGHWGQYLPRHQRRIAHPDAGFASSMASPA
jgi:hypothetical protein